MDYLKSWRYRKHVLTSNISIQTKIPRNKVVELDEKLELTDAVLLLPKKYRQVIIYRYFEELSIVEIAQMLSISSNTVKTRLKKSRALLKEQLKHKQWEELLNEGN